MFDTTTNGSINSEDGVKKPIFTKRVKPERNLWREDEILTLLRIFRDNNYVELLSDKATKSDVVFRGMEDQMARYGYNKKNFQQIWTKWKFLKSTYMTSRRANVIPKVITTKTYLALDSLLDGVFNAHQNYSDGDSFYDNGSRYDSEVSSICSTTNNNSLTINKNNSVSGFGMQHPIFGDMTDRLEDDYVKSEPLDIDEYNQQMQEADNDVDGNNENEENGKKGNKEANGINANKTNNSLRSALNALFSEPEVVEPTITLKTQVPRLKTVPLRKINLKQPQQPIPIAPVNRNVASMPKLTPKPTLPISSTPINSPKILPKLKLSGVKQQSPIILNNNNNNNISRNLERQRPRDECFEGQPPAKCQKTKEEMSVCGRSTPNKPKSIEMVKDMQRELVAEFFKKQQELITEEYEFQRKQDELLLKSFEDQNRILLTAAKNMIEQFPSNFFL